MAAVAMSEEDTVDLMIPNMKIKNQHYSAHNYPLDLNLNCYSLIV